MPPTIELTPEQLARLQEIAARRGHSDISTLVNEAIESWLDEQQELEEKRKRSPKPRGGLTDSEAARLAEAARKLKGS